MDVPEFKDLNERLQTLQRKYSEGTCTADELASYIEEIDSKKREQSEIRGKMYNMYISIRLKEIYGASKRK
jgi:hypothetical protein